MRSQNTLRVAAVVVALGLVGCAGNVVRPPDSPYKEHYNNQLRGVTLPSFDEIKDVGTYWAFPKSLDETWETILRVTTQYEGVLAKESPAPRHRRILVIHGQETVFETPRAGFHQNKSMVMNKFLDSWLTIDAIESPDGSETTVVAAWVQPTGKASKSNLSESAANKPVTSGSASNLKVLASALAEEQASVVIAMNETESPDDRWKYVPAATINEFFYQVGAQLLGPERWREKFGGAEITPEHTTSMNPNVAVGEYVEDVVTNPERRAIEETAGKWTSAKLRRAFVVVRSPTIEATMMNIVERLLSAAGKSNERIKVYIIASPQPNAFAIPNGDILVTTAMLEALETTDELAAVLAHELDHILQHDSMARLLARESADMQAQGIMVATSLIGAVVGAAIQMPTAGFQPASMSQQIAGNVVQNAFSTAGAVAGQSLGAEMVYGYAQEVELRADSNGAKIMAAAGYDASAEITMLEALKEIQATAAKRRELITSGFINAQPGLESRSSEMRKLVSELRN